MRHRTQRLERTLVGGAVALTLSLALAAPLAAQSPAPVATPAPPDTLTITTTFPSIEVDPGGEASFPLTVLGPQPERVDLAVSAAPEGFRTSIRGGGSIVGSVFTGGAEPPDLELRVDVPEGTPAGTYEVVLTGTAASGSADLPVDLIVSDATEGSVGLTTDFPALRGDSGATFQFNLRLANDTSQEITFGLSGLGPDGWTVDVTPTGQDQAATAVVGAGETQNIRVTVTPARFADAGQYPIGVVADGGSRRAEAALLVELTGSYAATLTSADGRLNITATAGSETTFGVIVTNTGTAPLEAVALTATAPSGWQVTFDTETIELIPVGGTATATARVVPSGNAVAGDYTINMTARNDQVNQSIQVRTTVETSSVWGFVGIALIGLVLVGLFLVFRRYGRR